jgi:succinate dehydrogenase / fumarate reductase cytochrome b subunit
MQTLRDYTNSSIGKKQIIAVTGLLLILYIVIHLAGNCLIFWGPRMFNAYANALHGLRPFLYVVEIGLALVFIVHIYFTYLIVLENLKARGGHTRYAVSESAGERSLATRLMPYTGTFLFTFIVWHLLDFTFINHVGPRGIMPTGINLGLYGVIYNSFVNPVHSGLYILAMGCLGFHLSHGVQSMVQTFGYNHPRYTPVIRLLGVLFGISITIGYSLIPVFVMLHYTRYISGVN